MNRRLVYNLASFKIVEVLKSQQKIRLLHHRGHSNHRKIKLGACDAYTPVIPVNFACSFQLKILMDTVLILPKYCYIILIVVGFEQNGTENGFQVLMSQIQLHNRLIT